MSLFGKDYDKQIQNLWEAINANIKSNNKSFEAINEELRRDISFLQDSLIGFGKIQLQHKAIIIFLVNHATVDEDCKDDLQKMMQEIVRVGNELKGDKSNDKHKKKE